MTKLDVEFLATAEDDLRNIAQFIAVQRGMPLAGLAYVDRIERRCLELGDWPGVGRQRDDLGRGIRTIPFESVLIVYRFNAERLTIVRILGQAQDARRHMPG